MNFEPIIDAILRAEQGYVDHPDDRGGPTNHGIILASAITTAPPALEPAAMHLEPGQAVQCKAEGGCVVFNIPGLEQALSAAHAAGAREKCGRGI